ncbi:MAG: efflux RND transporter periplasmic adaptor subunit [Firmicutes bacterium]|jgi:multidrug efflux pump subunit AcrA (membrane-fusion protein)|nr:efflux RND transporter periplasmic adaptor subunit [Bacillota bacterium]
MKREGKRLVKTGLIIVIAIVILGLGFSYLRTRRAQNVASTMPARREITVQRGDVIRGVSSTGTIAAARDLELAFDVGGKVKSISAQTTDVIGEGAVLAKLDDTRERLAYLSAKRDLELAKFEAAPSVIREKELALQLAEADLQGTSLVAPFSGVVAEIGIQEEEWVNSGTPVMRLLDTSRLFLEVGVDEVDIRHVQVGQKATIGLDAYPELTLSGTVVEVGIVPRQQGQIVVFPVRLEVDEYDPRVRVGMSAEAEIVVEKAENVLVVPFEAVAEARGRSTVIKVTDTGLESVEVVTGLSDGFSIEIKQGLNEGDRILATNHELYRSLQRGNQSAQRNPAIRMPAGIGGGWRP